jgi:hypothetical protein
MREVCSVFYVINLIPRINFKDTEMTHISILQTIAVITDY